MHRSPSAEQRAISLLLLMVVVVFMITALMGYGAIGMLLAIDLLICVPLVLAIWNQPSAQRATLVLIGLGAFVLGVLLMGTFYAVATTTAR